MMHPLLNIAIDAARDAGDYIARMYDQLDRVTVMEKSLNDYVTSVDQRSEEIIIKKIKSKYPRHNILAEESGYLQGDLKSEGDVRWIIDPLDGTFNFTRGFPLFAVSIGVEIKGIMELGVIYNPISQELFTGVKDSGVMLNHKRIRLSENRSIEKSLIGTGFIDENKNGKDYTADSNLISSKCIDTRVTGSAAINLAFVAAGRLDAYWEAGLKSWDVAAGMLIAKEAGAYVSDFNGEDKYLESGNVIAGTPKIHQELLEILK